MLIEPGPSGRFDVFVDETLKLSKHDLGRFPTDEEIAALAP